MKKALLCLCLGILNYSFAQKIELGLGLGPTIYKGDLQPTFRPLNPSAATNIFARYNHNRVFSFKLNGMAGFVNGNDKKSGNALNIARGLSFKQTIAEYNAQAEYNFLNFRTHNGRYESNWTPYVMAGLGQYISLKREFKWDVNVDANNKATATRTAFMYGIGFKKIWRNKWNYGVEFGTRMPLNKKYNDITFDNIGTDDKGNTVSLYPYAGVIDDVFKKPNTPQPDKYFYMSFSVSYLFYKVYCPTR
jgi:Domain of unknown function (DUF6089)